MTAVRKPSAVALATLALVLSSWLGSVVTDAVHAIDHPADIGSVDR